MTHPLATGQMYEKVAQSEEDVDGSPTEERRPWDRVRIVILAANLVIFTLTFVFYLVTMVTRLNSSDVKTTSSTTTELQIEWPDECGQSVEEAMSKDCALDVMSNLWTPNRCYNSTFALEALQGVALGTEGGGVGAPEFGLHTYQWFEDGELTRPISNPTELEQFLLQRDKRGLPLEAFTHMSFHAAHCSYFQRMAAHGLDRLRRGEKHVWIPAVTTQPDHARHCEGVFGELFRLGQAGERRNWTQVGFGFTPCVRLG
ncbi:hypothetical protein PRZ48_015262 [Zasmidium cellare]|uniref:Uncharacterized protein n=1 Tax=Zasmidium cellare TaxID=395010 RepID=A0ABR0DWM6_ZASCE|nr:hypothetical protein PRZ48_015262 [Zasmidium cellare]